MPIASENVPPNVPTPAPMPIVSYPMMPMYGCPPIDWCYPAAHSMPLVTHDDGYDMAPPAMQFDPGTMPHTAVGGASLPMSDNNAPAPPLMQDGEMAVPYTGQMPGTVSGMASPAAPAPMFPTAGMAPPVSYPMYGPMMPFGGMPVGGYYGPTSYYGGMAPYGAFYPAPYMPYR